MNNVQLQDLARIGAQTRLAALDSEREALLKMFPGLRAAQQPAGGKNGSALPATRRRGGMSPAARKGHGERMRAFWANRRAERERPAVSPREIAADASPTAEKEARSRKGRSPAARKAQGERMRAYWAAKRSEKNGATGTGAPAGRVLGARGREKVARKK